MRAFLLFAILVSAHPGFGQSIRFTDRTTESALSVDGRGRSVAVQDVDLDGDEDVFVAVSGAPSKLFLNDGAGVFTPDPSFPVVSGNFRVALFADVDHNGYPDLFLGGRDGVSRLLVHDEAGFVEADSGIDAADAAGPAAFGDFDGDGWVDLFVTVYEGPDRLYRNRGPEAGARFEDVSDWSGTKGPVGSVAMQSTWMDFDHDGDQDLFLVHDGTSYPSRLYVNDSGSLPMFDGAWAARIDSVGAGNSMGIAWGDFDGDGWEDAYVTRIGRGGLYRNNQDGTFTEMAVASGASRNGMSWGVVFSDFDNDGDSDLYIVNRFGFDRTPFLLYENRGGSFVDIAAAAGVAFEVDAQTLASGDFNGDGLVDLVSADDHGTVRLLQNVSADTGNWVQLRLAAGSAAQSIGRAVGARVEVVAGGRTLVGTVSGGDSYCSQSSGVLHFGLGTADHIDSIRIDWGTSIETRSGLPINMKHELIDPLARVATESDELAQTFSLDVNVPNPFETETRISYSLARTAAVRLEVVDVLGRSIAVLVDRRQPPGKHSTIFVANELPSGMYLYRITADRRSATRTLILAR